MRKREATRYRNLLDSQLAALAGQRDSAVQAMLGESFEEIPDPNDRATAESDKNWALRLRDRDRKLVVKIQRALARLDEGTFGLCESCGSPIASARLRARPVTSHCIECKTESERLER